ncbi:MAG: hypothetical protein H6815_09170 [Phycisphaeraceae bacterium]|nr:hypothetical protein [Phycisphaerales bacterium]MCB9860608.1 hypothetical protein [Phycisphaeraceae bacterium]
MTKTDVAKVAKRHWREPEFGRWPSNAEFCEMTGSPAHQEQVVLETPDDPLPGADKLGFHWEVATQPWHTRPVLDVDFTGPYGGYIPLQTWETNPYGLAAVLVDPNSGRLIYFIFDDDALLSRWGFAEYFFHDEPTGGRVITSEYPDVTAVSMR